MFMRKFSAAIAVLGVFSAIAAPIATASPADFQNCLQSNGVNVKLPDSPPPPPKGTKGQKPPQTPPAPPGVDQGTWTKAFAACKQFAPAPPR